MTRRSVATEGHVGSEDDDRPPICPACGVTMGLLAAADGSVSFACLECGFDGGEAIE